MPDALLDQYLACAGYSGAKKVSRAARRPPARDARRGRPGAGKTCFVGSAYQDAAPRRRAGAGGVGDAALATLGF
jgi:hypothetical protein